MMSTHFSEFLVVLDRGISGGSLFETNMEGHQQVKLGPRPRPLTCLANSPCGKWWAMGESCFGGRSGQVGEHNPIL